MRPGLVLLVVLASSACLQRTARDGLAHALGFAEWELVTASTCTRHVTGVCANDARLRFVHSSNGFTWSSSWYEGERLVAERAGGCLSRSERGVAPPCDEADAGVTDLCEVAFNRMVVVGLEVNHWPDGGFVRRRLEPGRHDVEFPHYVLTFEVSASPQAPVGVWVKSIDEGFLLRPWLDDARVRLGPPLEPGDEVPTTDLVLHEVGVGSVSAMWSFRPRYALRPDAGAFTAAPR